MSLNSPGIADLLGRLLGPDPQVAVTAYDGSRIGPADAAATVHVRSPMAIRRILSAPGELGFARAYVAGDMEMSGDIYAVLSLVEQPEALSAGPRALATLTRLVRRSGVVGRPPPPPPEEARLHGRRHTRKRDAAAISHHYDVGNHFYRLLLGPTMTYSCAVWADPSVGVDAAQEAKHELVCRKLGLRPGQRLLDVGCGWGSMVMHAAQHHGVSAVGVTLSSEQVALGRKRVADAGLTDRVEIRLCDYRDIADGPFDAISSIGMFEHVGASRLNEYFTRLHALLVPTGRLLNHGIARPPSERSAFNSRSFIHRYVFPDGELHEVGRVISSVQRAGFEVRHSENLREHYALTLRAWVDNLERSYDEAVALVGPGRARVWHLYLAGSALAFESGGNRIHQTLAVKLDDSGRSGMPLRPDWDDGSPAAGTG
jgi:cyclopropane-fatty-acyl-phospholipid synthase